MASDDPKPPWKRKAPARARKTTLTAELRHKAKARARAAGRRYPNLVDNMWAAAQQKAARKRTRVAKKR